MKRSRPPSQVNGHFFHEVHAQFPLGIIVERPAADLHRYDEWEEDRLVRLYKASAIKVRQDFEAILGPLERPPDDDATGGGAQ
jgi:hypothetical protein